jgi:hypothetical protein
MDPVCKFCSNFLRNWSPIQCCPCVLLSVVPMLSYSSFKVLYLTLRSFIHFELTFMRCRDLFSIFYVLMGLVFHSELCTCKAGTLAFQSHLQSILLWLPLEMGSHKRFAQAGKEQWSFAVSYDDTSSIVLFCFCCLGLLWLLEVIFTFMWILELFFIFLWRMPLEFWWEIQWICRLLLIAAIFTILILPCMKAGGFSIF